jgi:hypothetical protein
MFCLKQNLEFQFYQGLWVEIIKRKICKYFKGFIFCLSLSQGENGRVKLPIKEKWYSGGSIFFKFGLLDR